MNLYQYIKREKQMRKQTKLAILVGAMSIAGAMTSFAATGWQQENGTWVYYDKNEEKVSQKWQQSGEYWYYLDDMGDMATDALIDDGNATYYVDINGAMVKNRWVAIPNTNDYDENEPDQWWYYFGENGKAFKRSDSTTSDVTLKTINGKKYAFDLEGRMLYGWVSQGERLTDQDAWQNAKYYFGDENDGAMTTGWREILVHDDNARTMEEQPNIDYWDTDQVRWFYFKESGKKETDNLGKTINGKKYGFDEYGRMIASWYTEATPSTAVSRSARVDYTESFMYFATPEDGAKSTKGWFKVVPGYFLNKGKWEEDGTAWYYADGKGHICANEIKSINGKKYAFDDKGGMISGLGLFEMKLLDNGKYSATEFVDKLGAGNKTVPYSTQEKFVDAIGKIHYSDFLSGKYRMMYFGDGKDGAQKYGKQTVKLDGEDRTFYFKEGGSNKGSGFNGIKDERLYIAGLNIKADQYDKYEVVVVDKSNDNQLVYKGTVGELLTMTGYVASVEEKDNKTTWKITTPNSNYQVKLLGSSGTIVKNGTKRDGEDYKIKVNNKVITSVTLE